MSLQYEKELAIQSTNIPGLLVLDLSVHGDNRGWFKENWQQKRCVIWGCQILNQCSKI